VVFHTESVNNTILALLIIYSNNIQDKVNRKSEQYYMITESVNILTNYNIDVGSMTERVEFDNNIIGDVRIFAY
jgi:hypothetical protein